jgi:hypothetical protein
MAKAVIDRFTHRATTADDPFAAMAAVRLALGLVVAFVAKEWRAAPRRRSLLFAHCDHADGRARMIAPGTEGPTDAVEKQ